MANAENPSMGRFGDMFKIVWMRAIGFVIFVVVMLFLYFLVPLVDNVIYAGIVTFIKDNLFTIFLINLLMLFAELFYLMIFPLNLPAPLFNALASVFIVSFIFRLIDLVTGISMGRTFNLAKTFSYPVYFVVFLVVIVVGYVSLLVKPGSRSEHKTLPHDSGQHTIHRKRKISRGR
jgi:hypothetical protein